MINSGPVPNSVRQVYSRWSTSVYGGCTAVGGRIAAGYSSRRRAGQRYTTRTRHAWPWLLHYSRPALLVLVASM